jgi:glycosyltransferase involved in cell wall biosynthesis
MRIGIDARYAGDHFPGIGRYILGLARALAELKTEHTLVLIAGGGARRGRYDLEALTGLPGVEVARLGAGPFGPAQHLALPLLARRLRLDLLHAPYFVRPTRWLPCPVVVTVYDLIGLHFPGTLSWRGRLLYRASMARSIRAAAGVLTISESARADLQGAYGLPAERLAVTPLAADGRFRPRPAEDVALVRARHDLPERYVLYVGSNKPHKNIVALARAWERLRARGAPEVEGCALVIAGHQDRKHRELARLARAEGAGSRIRLLPNVADAELPALYSGATVFAFPSLYEGFGLPPLEAMACGAPVLYARSASLPEVVADAGLSFDPTSEAELSEGLARLLGDPGLRRELRARGLRRAGEYSWRRTALETLRIYERIARQRGA